MTQVSLQEEWARFDELIRKYKESRSLRTQPPFNIIDLSDAIVILIRKHPPKDRTMVRKDIVGIIGSKSVVKQLIALRKLIPEARPFFDPGSTIGRLTFADGSLLAKTPADRQLQSAHNLLVDSDRSSYYHPQS